MDKPSEPTSQPSHPHVDDIPTTRRMLIEIRRSGYSPRAIANIAATAVADLFTEQTAPIPAHWYRTADPKADLQRWLTDDHNPQISVAIQAALVEVYRECEHRWEHW